VNKNFAEKSKILLDLKIILLEKFKIGLLNIQKLAKNFLDILIATQLSNYFPARLSRLWRSVTI